MLEAKTFRVWFGATVLMCAISCGEALSAQEKPHSIASDIEYRIRAGDVIKVDVWRHPEITRTVSVDRKGNITLPSVHGVKVLGLSAMDLAGLIRQKLEGIIPDPQVTVTIAIKDPLSAPSPQPQTPLRRQESSPSPDLKQKCCVA